MTKVYCDGGSRGNPGNAACAFVVFNLKDVMVVQEGKYLGKTTNNVAEYNAVISALIWLGEQNSLDLPINFYLDSQLVVSQLTGKFKVKSQDLLPLVVRIKNLEKKLHGKINYFHITRNFNKKADLLVNEILDKQSENSNSKSV